MPGDKDPEILALEPISPDKRAAVLAAVAEGIAQEVLGSEQAPQKPRDPRIMRLLKSINPEAYKTLQEELRAILLILASPTTNPATKNALQIQIADTIEKRLWPSFTDIVVAEGLLAEGEANFHLRGLTAAVKEMPTATTHEAVGPQGDQQLVALYQAATGLRLLQAAAWESSEAAEGKLGQYLAKKFNREKDIKWKKGRFFTVEDWHEGFDPKTFVRFVRGEGERLGIKLDLVVQESLPHGTNVRLDVFSAMLVFGEDDKTTPPWPKKVY